MIIKIKRVEQKILDGEPQHFCFIDERLPLLLVVVSAAAAPPLSTSAALFCLVAPMIVWISKAAANNTYTQNKSGWVFACTVYLTSACKQNVNLGI